MFFVPGWTDNAGHCWDPLKKLVPQILTNPSHVTFINFEAESKNCQSFLDFGEYLKKKVKALVRGVEKYDLVGHSMGGLDIRAAITQGKDALTSCSTCITVATPHRGDNFGGVQYSSSKNFFLRRLINFFHPVKDYELVQGRNLDPDHAPIQLINTLENRRLFLERIERLYQLKGTQDFLVKGSAIMDKTGVETLYAKKSREYTVGGANHSGDIGIPQDIRTIVLIGHLLLELPVPQETVNLGLLREGVYTPEEEKDRFI